MVLGFVYTLRQALAQYNLECDFDFGKSEYVMQVRVSNPNTKKIKYYYVRFTDEESAQQSAAELIDSILESELMIG